jgi:hypothetical protein
MVSHRLVPIAAITILIAGCLELSTTPPPNDIEESSGSSSSGSSNGSSGLSTSSSSSSSSTSSSSSSTSASSSSSAASSGTPVMHEIIAKSDLGMTIQNDSSGVVCGVDMQTLPSGMAGTALECTHVTDTSGIFFHGLTVNLQVDVPYVFSFFFRNGSFDSPYGHLPPDIGSKMVGPNTSGGGQMQPFDSYSNGWYRQRYMFTASSTGSYQLGFMHSLNRPPGGGYWLYGFQVETGSDVTTYVPE